MEPVSHLDSAGSCDSVISMNSGYSEDSMEHLSAEERACLMYLEETIEALEVQEDSGLSNDEPDPGFHADTMGQMKANYISSFKFEESGGVHSPQSSNAKDLQTSVNLMTQTKPPATESVADCKIHPSATPLSVFTGPDGQLKIAPSASLCPGQSPEASEIDVVVIPPPSDFMDEPSVPPQPQTVIKDPPLPAGISNVKPKTTIDLEQLRQRASVKRTSLNTSVTPEPRNKPPGLSPLTISSGPPLSPPPDAAELRSPPVVAPKPKKLPASILLKPHKAGSDGHSLPTSSDRVLLDPQKVRIEALRKLGLLPAEGDFSPVQTPDASPLTRRSWTAPASPVSPRAPQTVAFTPPYNRVNSLPGASVPQHSPAVVSPLAAASAPEVQPAEIIPAPAAFSDPIEPPASDNELSAAKDASEVNARVSTPPLTPAALIKHLTPPKFTDVKSATLERSGLGLSSYLASQNTNKGSLASQLRKNRARPASLGGGIKFTSAGEEGSQVGLATSKEPDLRRSLPANTAFQPLGDSSKLPRSEGVSVLICPRAENEEDRRNALKKLGLLRD